MEEEKFPVMLSRADIVFLERVLKALPSNAYYPAGPRDDEAQADDKRILRLLDELRRARERAA